MERILCYGDSNTWGQSDHDTRYPETDQWPMILRQQLGDGFHVVQEGLGGRNAGNYDADETYRNGQDPFDIIYRSAAPLDVLVLSLGTNDLKTKYGRSAEQIAGDLQWYQRRIEGDLAQYGGPGTKIVYVAPATFSNAPGYFDASQKTRDKLVVMMQQFDAPVVTADELPISADGVHYTPEAHHLLADKLTTKIMEILA
jgi:lysophospholipase L1-like esterase